MTQSADGITDTVVLHNNLIRHLPHGLAKLGAMEHKIIAMAVAQIDHRHDESIPILEIEISKLAKLSGMTGGNIYPAAHAAAKALIGEVIEFTDPKKPKRTILCSWMAAATYTKGEGVLRCEFSKHLTPYLLQLKALRTEMQLSSILRIGGSGYAHRLYQLCCSWRSNRVWSIPIEELRELLGVKKGAYSRTIDFRRYSLDAPIKTINDRTDIKIAYEKGNKGRSWTHVKFSILDQSPPKIKEAKKLSKSDEWWDLKVQTAEGSNEIWEAAYTAGLVLTANRGHAVLSAAHGLYQHREALHGESMQTHFPDLS